MINNTKRCTLWLMNRFLWKVTIHTWQTIIDGQFCIATLSYRRVQLWFALESGTLPTPGSAASENSHEFLAVAFSKVARHQLSHSILMGSKQKHVLGTLDLLPVNRIEKNVWMLLSKFLPALLTPKVKKHRFGLISKCGKVYHRFP